jgi:hypothetical protein
MDEDERLMEALARTYPYCLLHRGTTYRFASASAMWEFKDLMNL